jgi:hypothetical protein
VSLILLRSMQLSGTCGEMPPRRPRCLGLHITRDSDWLMVKQGCWKSEDQGHQFRYHMTRKLRDAFPSGLHRDAFQQLAPDRNRDAFTRGNFCPRGEILKSRRDSPQNTRVGHSALPVSVITTACCTTNICAILTKPDKQAP